MHCSRYTWTGLLDLEGNGGGGWLVGIDTLFSDIMWLSVGDTSLDTGWYYTTDCQSLLASLPHHLWPSSHSWLGRRSHWRSHANRPQLLPHSHVIVHRWSKWRSASRPEIWTHRGSHSHAGICPHSHARIWPRSHTKIWSRWRFPSQGTSLCKEQCNKIPGWLDT